MSFSHTISCLPLSNTRPQDGSPDIAIGPLKIRLGRDMQGLAWRNRFDFIFERTGYRPERGQWFETWQDSPEVRGEYHLGRKSNLLTRGAPETPLRTHRKAPWRAADDEATGMCP